MKLNSFFIAIVFATNTASFACNSITSNHTKMTQLLGESTPKSVLLAYLKAGDESDVTTLNKLTHQSYRVIFNDLSKNEVSEIKKSTYLDLIQKKDFGGKPRLVEVKTVDMMGNNIASIKVTTKSESGTFNSYFSLIKDQGKWYILQDLIYIE